MAQAQVIAKVSSISGEAFVRDSAGHLRRLAIGDVIREGETVVAAEGGEVILKLADGRDLPVFPKEHVLLDAEVAALVKPDAGDSAVVNDPKGFQKIAQALNDGGNLDDLLEDPAAGAAGAGGNEGHSFIEFLRVVETVDPLAYRFATERGQPAGVIDDGVILTANDTTTTAVGGAPVAVDDQAGVGENATPNTVSGNVLSNDTIGPDGARQVGGVAAPITPVDQDLAYGHLTLNADGTYTYTLDNANPTVNALNDGQTLTDSVSYTLTDGDGTSTTATLTLTINGHTDGTPTIVPHDTDGNLNATDTTLPETAGATADTFTIGAQAGIDHITVGGTPFSLAELNALGSTPITVSTAAGTLILTGYDAGTGQVSYTYDPNVLTHTAGTPIVDSIALGITDANGVTSNASLDIAITDSTPTAQADTNTVTEDTSPTATGNVLPNDTVGADTNATPITPVDQDLAYGHLTLNGDGTYTYTLDNTNPAVNALNDGQTLTDSVTYTLTDGDGSTTTATLTLTINGHSDGTPTIDVPVPAPGSGTNNGSDADLTVPETAAATAGQGFDIHAQAGVDHITVGSTTLTLAQLNALGSTPVSITTADGTLTLTGYVGDATGGHVSYTYDPNVLSVNATVTDHFTLTITDSNGVTGSANSLDVAILDSTPTAQADTASISEDASPNTVSGSVLGNDTVGADTNATPITPVNQDLTYGHLTLNSDGTYTYTLDNTNPAVNALNDGQTLTDSVSYTLTDGDGTSTTATLSITINGHTDGTPTIVPHDTDGNLNATDTTLPETAGATADTFTIGAQAGIDHITVGGTPVSLAELNALGSTPITVSTADGTLILTGYDAGTGQVSYTYDPNVLTHTAGTPIVDSIALGITDANGVTSNASLDVAILDSTPTAQADSNTVTEDSVLTATGNVLPNDTVGADTNVTPITPVDQDLTYGHLTLNSDGTYTYTLDNTNPAVNALNDGQTLTDSVSYTLTDGDGTSTTATLSITINGHTDGTPTIVPHDTDGNLNATDTTLPETAGATADYFTIGAQAGIDHITVGGTPVSLAELNNLTTTPITVTTADGTLILTGFDAGSGQVSYTYDPNVLTHTAGTPIVDSIALGITDANGVTSNASLDIAITDSTPTAQNDTASITEDASPNTVNGSVLPNDTVGADSNATPITPVDQDLAYGHLTLNADGSYTYTLDNTNPTVNALNDGQTLSDSVTYTLTDGDGSTTTATLTLTINGHTDGTPTIVPHDTDGNLNATDTTLPETAGATADTFTIGAQAGIDHITVGGTTLTLAQLNNLGSTPVTVSTADGTLILTGYDAGTGQVSYTYDPNVLTHTAGTPIVDSIALGITDANGVTSNASLDVAILDSTPTAQADSNTVTEDSVLTATGNVLPNDTVGADTNATPITPVDQDLAYGHLTLNGDGTYTYTLDNTNPAVNALNDGQTLTDSVTYTLTDGDGSTTTATLTLTINGHSDGTPTIDVPVPAPGSGTNNGSDADLTVPETAAATAGQGFDIHAQAGVDHITVGSTTLSLAQLNALGSTPVSITTADGTLTLTGYVGDATGGHVSYSYDPNVLSANATVTDHFTLTITDVNGVTGAANSLDVAILDSTPTAQADTASISEDASPNTVSGSVLGNDTVGADTNATPITPVNQDLAYGHLTLNADGSYTYTLDNGNPTVNALNDGQTLTDSVTYTLTDGDGSTTTATLTLTINGHSDGTPTIDVPVPAPGSGNNNGSDADLTVPETAAATAGQGFDIHAQAGVDHITVGSTTLTLAQLNALGSTPVSITTADGTLTLTGYTGDATGGHVSYSYDPNVLSANATVTDHFTLTITDSNGVTGAANSLDVAILDSTPNAQNDTASISEDASPNTVSGSVLGNDTVGADTNATPITPVDQDLAYGHLTLNSDGTYTYTLDNTNPAVNALNDGQTLTDSVSYTLTDGDGTSTTATLTLTINGHTDGTPSIVPHDTDGNLNATDTTLPETAGATADTFTIGAQAGIDHITVGGTPVSLAELNALGSTPITVSTADGTLILTGYDAGTGQVSYTYDPNVLTHTAGTPIVDSIALGITDANGVTSNASLDIAITDSTPNAQNDTASISEDASPNTVSGSVLGNDTVGADTNATPITPVDQDLAYGHLTLNGDGTYTYTLDNTNPAVNALNDGQTLTDSVSYTLTDGDGTSTTATLTLTINGHSDGTPTIDVPVPAPGSGNNNGSSADLTVAETEGDTAGLGFDIHAQAGVDHITVGSTTLSLAQLNALGSTPVSITTADGTLTLTGYAGDATGGHVSYSYDPNVLSANATVTDHFALTITDSNGVTGAANSLDVAILDSTPTAQADTASISEDASPNTVSGSVLGNDTVGADTNATPITPVNQDLAYGHLTLNGDGTYTYTLDNGNPAVNALNDGQTLTDSVTYTLTDGDGSTTTATLTITINGSNDAPIVSGGVVSGFEDTALLLSWANFGISDVDSPTITAATISSLPADGTLQVFDGASWNNVAAGDVVSKATVDAGHLRFVPDANESGSNVYATPGTGDQHADYASFQITATDSQGSSTTGTVTVDIAPVVDPVNIAANNTLTATGTAVADLIVVPGSEGLTKTVYTGVGGGATIDSSTLETLSDGLSGGLTTTVTQAYPAGGNGVDNIPVGNVEVTTGLIYLEAGQSIAFSGYVDDSLRIELGGNTLISTTGDAWGDYDTGVAGTIASTGNGAGTVTTAGTFTVTQTGYYTLEMYVYNHNGPGDMSVNVSIDGQAAVPLSTSGLQLYTDIAYVDAHNGQHSDFVLTAGSDGGVYPVQLNTGLEDSTIKLTGISGTFGDVVDNSESHVITVSGIPAGATISDGTHSFTATAGLTSATLWNEDNPTAAVGGSNWDLDKLTITPPTDFNGTIALSVTATAVEIATGETANATTTLDVTVLPVNDAPVLGLATPIAVSEEGLANGLPDTLGTSDTTDSATASGTIAVSDVDSAVTVSLTAPTTSITSDGVAVTWSGSGTHTLIGSANGAEVIRATIDDNGNYTVTLEKAIDQPAGNGENTLSFNLGVSASDGVNVTSSSIAVTVEDDAPVTSSAVQNVDVHQLDTNLMLVLDLSGSMSGTNLTNAKAAIVNLINAYDGYGDVAVKLVTFSTTAAEATTSWVTAADAISLVNALSASGNTNYDAALAQAIESWDSAGKILTAPAGGTLQNVSYFLSDGVPTVGDGNSSSLLNVNGGTSSDLGIQGAEQSIWTNFLTANSIKSYALGFGGATQTPLDPIAYDGASGSDMNAIVVSTSGLNTVLQSTVTPVVTGNLLYGATPGAVGADGGYVGELMVGPAGDMRTFSWDIAANTVSASGPGGSTSTYDAANHVLNVTTEQGGLLVIDLDSGAYSYTPPVSMSGPISEVVGFTLHDFDGDTSTGQITFNLTRDSGALAITGDGNGTTITGTSADEIISGLAGNDTIYGGDGNDWLSGGAGTDTLYGEAGNDKLDGGTGNDTLNGGAGNDLLIGGAGSDTLTGGAGADTFQWSLGDHGSSYNNRAIDTITDFDVATPANGGDILDLRDLLVGENHLGTAGNLTDYLHFSKSGANTVIDVKSDGASGAVTQQIVLSGVDLTANNTLNDTAIIHDLLTKGKLATD